MGHTAERGETVTQESRAHVESAIKAWLAPLLIVALGAMISFQWRDMSASQRQLAKQVQTISVQLATMAQQRADQESSISAMQTSISQIQTVQADHEHRITVLEQRR